MVNIQRWSTREVLLYFVHFHLIEDGETSLTAIKFGDQRRGINNIVVNIQRWSGAYTLLFTLNKYTPSDVFHVNRFKKMRKKYKDLVYIGLQCG